MDEISRPTGTVTFLFSDIEGSTEIAASIGADKYRLVLEQHQHLMRNAFAAHRGRERGTEGDSFFVVFRDAPSAVAAAVQAQRSFAEAVWPHADALRVRMGIHTGLGVDGGDDYVGIDVNRAARIAAAAHGGQVLISDTTRSLSAATLPVGVAVRDVGWHRLKGIPDAEHLFQLTIQGLVSEFPPVRSLQIPLTNLPVRTSSFIGREREIQEISAILGDARLVTLIGPGGTGKTALAIETARAVADELDEGAWFVGLDAIRRADLVGSAIVAALGLRDVSGRPSRERLVDNLSGRSLLLVLDNFEQVIDAAPLVAELLAAAPRIRAIVTSRAPLHLTGEHVYPVPSLSVPGAAEADFVRVGEWASVALFVDRARSVQPNFSLTAENSSAVAEICRQMDGLPLGIELAAARVRMLGPAGILERLQKRMALGGVARRDAQPRQRTLEAAIGWSHELLDLDGRKLFAQLAVFSDGWRLEQAETVCGASREASAPTADVLEGLVEQSLVATSPVDAGVRYEMLETIRQFADVQLRATDGNSELRRRHAYEYLALAETLAPDVESLAAAGALSRMREERENLRSATGYALVAGDAELGLRLAQALGRFLALSGEVDDGLHTLRAILDMPGADKPTVLRVRALEACGNLAYYAGDDERSRQLYREQLEVAATIGDRQGVADARYNLLFTEYGPGDEARALAGLDDIEAAYVQIGDARGAARTLWARGAQLISSGRAPEAIDVLEEAMRRYRDGGDYAYMPQAAGLLAMAYLGQGDAAAGTRWLLEGFSIAHAVRNLPMVTAGIPTIAITAFHLGRPEPAAVLLGAYEGLSRRYGVKMPENLERYLEARDPLAQIENALDGEVFEAARSRGRDMSLDDLMEFLSVLASDAAGPPAAASSLNSSGSAPPQ